MLGQKEIDHYLEGYRGSEKLLKILIHFGYIDAFYKALLWHNDPAYSSLTS